MQRKVFIAAAVLAAGIAIALTLSFFRTQSRSPGLASATLADGTQVIIQAVTLGTNHVFTHGSKFLAALKEILPPRTHKWLGTQSTSRSTTADPTAIIWFSGFNPATEQYTYLNPDNFRIIDEHGCVLQINSYSGGSSDPSFSVQNAYANVLPRRQKHFILRATFSSQPPVEFKIPNPQPFSAGKEWTPETLPASRTLGGTNIVLSRIRGHFHKSGHWFEPRLKIEVDGQDRTKWFKSQVYYRDVTGNRSHTLCPYEPAWKLEYDIFHSHEAPFAENEILRIADLPVPKPGEVVPFTQAKTFGNLSVQFIALCGPGDYKFSNGVCIASAPYDGSMGEMFGSSSSSGPPPRVELSFRRKKPSVLVQITGLERSEELLVRGREDSGKLFAVSFNGSADRTYRYDLSPSTNATRFALELIQQKPLRVEYTVAPPRPPLPE